MPLSHETPSAEDTTAEDAYAGRPRALRRAVREDAAEVRDWARHRGSQACEAIRDEPIRMTLYALGVGVLIGLLAAR
ncbi:hypothetical protein [Brevundimonas diminuta]|uniref:hypothetical protein n=1 Tax=Brevundimonas diminuta TaxID=293 RepID=UPI003D02C0D3